MSRTSLNKQIAMKFVLVWDWLERRGGSPFRLSAYLRASETVSRLVWYIG